MQLRLVAETERRLANIPGAPGRRAKPTGPLTPCQIRAGGGDGAGQGQGWVEQTPLVPTAQQCDVVLGHCASLVHRKMPSA